MSDGERPQAAITELLHRWQGGDQAAFDELVPTVYDELRRLARVLVAKERVGLTLDCTALVHEAYLRLMDQTRMDWSGRAHFFGAAARAMRRVLVDRARARNAQKRGDGAQAVELDELVLAEEPDLDVMLLEQALQELEAFDAERARIVELRFFGGLSVEEAAVVVGSSAATVKRDWAVARAWLYRRMTGEAAD